MILYDQICNASKIIYSFQGRQKRSHQEHVYGCVILCLYSWNVSRQPQKSTQTYGISKRNLPFGSNFHLFKSIKSIGSNNLDIAKRLSTAWWPGWVFARSVPMCAAPPWPLQLRQRPRRWWRHLNASAPGSVEVKGQGDNDGSIPPYKLWE